MLYHKNNNLTTGFQTKPDIYVGSFHLNNNFECLVMPCLYNLFQKLEAKIFCVMDVLHSAFRMTLF